jgi:hypothetical protein
MRIPNHKKPLGARSLVIAAMLTVSITSVVFAIDGVLTNGGRSASTKNSYSNLKKDLRMSLNSGFMFHDNRNMGSLKGGKSGQLNSVMSVQKGNVTLFLPMKTKPVMNRFRTPTAPPVR